MKIISMLKEHKEAYEVVMPIPRTKYHEGRYNYICELIEKYEKGIIK